MRQGGAERQTHPPPNARRWAISLDTSNEGKQRAQPWQNKGGGLWRRWRCHRCCSLHEMVVADPFNIILHSCTCMDDGCVACTLLYWLLTFASVLPLWTRSYLRISKTWYNIGPCVPPKRCAKHPSRSLTQIGKDIINESNIQQRISYLECPKLGGQKILKQGGSLLLCAGCRFHVAPGFYTGEGGRCLVYLGVGCWQKMPLQHVIHATMNVLRR